MKQQLNLSGFINTGFDNFLSQFIRKSVQDTAYTHEDKIQRLITVHNKQGTTYQRRQWINPESSEVSIHQGFRQTQSWENQSKATQRQIFQFNHQLEDIDRAISQTLTSTNTTISKIRKLKGKIRQIKDQIRRNPKNQNLQAQLTQYQENLDIKQNDLQELYSQKEEIDYIKTKTTELRDWLKKYHKNTNQWYNVTREDLEEFTRRYQGSTTVTDRDIGRTTNRMRLNRNEQREFNMFRRECENRYRTNRDPRTGQLQGFTTYTGQVITSVDAQHLWKRTQERGFSFEDIEYILKNPKYVAKATDPDTGRSALVYATNTRGVIVLQGGTIKTCYNIDVIPPTNYARWNLRGWNYRHEEIADFKNQWYQDHPEDIEKDRQQDENWISVWRQRGYDLEAEYALKDPRGNVIRDSFGQLTWLNHGRALNSFKRFQDRYKQQHPNFDIDKDYQLHYPDEFVAENERQLAYTGRNSQHDYNIAYQNSGQNPPKEEPLLHQQRRRFEQAIEQCRQLIEAEQSFVG